MSRWPLWAILAPGEPARLEDRALGIVMPDWDEEDGGELPFEIIPGSGGYHAIVGTDPSYVGTEMQIAEKLSLECTEPVYSIERANDPWTVMSWRNGALEILDVGPESLAKSLGCPLPERECPEDSPARKPLRTVALAEGVREQEARRVLEEDAGEPLPPGYYRLEDSPRGLLIASGTGDIGYADMTVSERFPHATVYAVTASPNLEMFFVTVFRKGESVEKFAQPQPLISSRPTVNEIKGERSPERILTALGIPAEWFRNQ
ncbi:hypothetical protein KYC5002_30675 [Archangium violaceum]|uniref:hypothetical protein n=1 Tax=Archangium violaceum TaxID=83451 RepID=UPI002B30C587|nr:hypothetical protein KYC5002_30675 [Archangium gephyra]